MKEQKDLFQEWENLPKQVQDLLNESEGADYNDLDKLDKKLRKLGYSFDYGLDAVPYNLWKLKTYLVINGKTSFEMKCRDMGEARHKANNTCDHSKEIIVREIEKEEKEKEYIYITEDDYEYTENDFLEIAKGNKGYAEDLIDRIEWQHPSTLVEEDLTEGEIIEFNGKYYRTGGTELILTDARDFWWDYLLFCSNNKGEGKKGEVYRGYYWENGSYIAFNTGKQGHQKIRLNLEEAKDFCKPVQEKKIFWFEVQETYSKTVFIEADNEEEAKELITEVEVNMTGEDYLSDSTHYFFEGEQSDADLYDIYKDYGKTIEEIKEIALNSHKS